MRIVLVCRAYPTHRPGGMPFVCQDRARALAAVGNDVHVLTTSHPHLPDYVEDAGVQVHHLKAAPSQAYTDGFASACAAATRALAPDVLHLDSFDRDRLWWADGAGARRTAITMHGFGPGAFLTQWNLYLAGRGPTPTFDAASLAREAHALRGADVVIGISRHELWQLVDVYNLTNARLVYNPIAPAFFATPPTDPADARGFMSIGNPGTSGNRAFDIAGAAARAARVPFRAVTDVSREALPAMYDAHRALVLPTFWSQGYDLTVAEALARRRPIIVTATGSYWQEREASPYMVHVPRGDHAAIARYMAGDLPSVPPGAADLHRPQDHAAVWLEAVS